MVYPTPGFVVRQTFLEFKEGQEVEEQPSPLRKVASDSELLGLRREERDSLYGSEDLRRFVEVQQGTLVIPELSSDRSENSFSLFAVPFIIQEQAQGLGDELDEVPWSSQEASELVVAEPHFTTIFLQNLPIECDRDVLCQIMNAEGFATCYDFVYVPVDLLTMYCQGYGFVNFTCHDDAERFLRVFHGYCRWPVPSVEICVASWSSFCQGLQAHVARYRNSPVMHEKVDGICKPMLFNHGMVIPFPAPTKRLRVPRIRRKTSERCRGGKMSISRQGLFAEQTIKL